MRDLAVLFLHLLATVARLAGPGGARSVVAESVLVKHQLLILNRSRNRSPPSASLIAWGRPVCGAHAPAPADPFRHCPQTFNTLEPSSSADTAEISTALLVHDADEGGPKGTH